MAQGGGTQGVLCRYFMSNVCNKGDQCRFSHDPSCAQPSMVCRYFLKGTCAYGEKCRYEHAWPEYMGTVTKIGESGSAPTSPQPTTDVEMKTKKPVPEHDVLSSHHQQNMVNISSVSLGGAGLTPVLARVTPMPPPAAATLAAAATPVPATTATLLHPPHPPPPHLQPPPAQPTALITDGLVNAQNMVKLVSISITQFVAMILDAHRIPHTLQSYKNKRSMTVEDARNSAQNLLAYVHKLGWALHSCLSDTTGDSCMELGNLLLRFWTEAKEPYPDLAFTSQDLHQVALHPEGRRLLDNTLNQLQQLMGILKTIPNQQ